MQNYTAFPIVDLRAGLNLSAEPWMIPMQAFTVAEDVYFYQGRVIKRKGYEKFATGTQVWDLDYDGGQNEPDVGDKVTSTLETAGAYVKSYTVDTGAWATDDAAGTIRFTKAGSETVAFADDEDLTNATQSNTLAGGAGLGADGIPLKTAHNYLVVPPVMGIYNYFTTGGSSYLIIFDKDYLYQYDSTNDVWVGKAGYTTLTPDFTGDDSQFFWCETWKDLLFIANNKDAIQYWNGSSLTEPTYTFNGDTLDTCLIIIVHKNRLIFLNTEETGTRFPQRARCSNVGSYSSTSDDIYVDADTVDWITGVSFVRGELMVFFERSVWWLRYTGDADNPFTWERIAETEGCYATYSVINFEDEAIALGPTSWIGSDGIRVYDITDKIPDLILSMNQNKLDYAYGFLAEEMRQYLCSYPSQGEDYPDKMLCMNYLDNCFSIYNLAMHVAGYWTQGSDWTFDDITVTMDEMDWSFDDKTLVAGYPTTLIGDRNGYVHTLFRSNKDDGSTITSRLKTKRLVPYSDSKAKLGYVDFIGDAGSGMEFTAKLYKDYSDIAFLTQTVSMEEAGKSKTRQRVRIMERGERFMIEITDTGNKQWALDAIVPHFRPAGNM